MLKILIAITMILAGFLVHLPLSAMDFGNLLKRGSVDEPALYCLVWAKEDDGSDLGKYSVTKDIFSVDLEAAAHGNPVGFAKQFRAEDFHDAQFRGYLSLLFDPTTPDFDPEQSETGPYFMLLNFGHSLGLETGGSKKLAQISALLPVIRLPNEKGVQLRVFSGQADLEEFGLHCERL